MSEAWVTISPGTAEFDAWLAFYRGMGSKSEARMLSCLVRPQRDFQVPSRWPPEPADAALLSPQPVVLVSEPVILIPLASDDERPREFKGNADALPEEVKAEFEQRTAERQTRLEAEDKIERRRQRDAAKTEDALETAFQAARENRHIDLDDIDELDVIEVEDPEELRDFEAVQMTGRRRTIRRQRVTSLKDDPIGRMAKRGHLGEEGEAEIRLRAARLYQAVYYRAEVAAGAAGDPFKPIVDGDVMVSLDTDARNAAFKRMIKVHSALGVDGVEILRAVLITKWEMQQLAAARGRVSKREINYLGRRLCEVLDRLASMFGIAPRPNRPQMHRDFYADLATVAKRPLQRGALHRGRTEMVEVDAARAEANASKPTLRAPVNRAGER